uniref:Peptidase aspartic putative domain-containing protein n=1 Tax=Strigamia maritima TaxID=126957 RepID=T1J0W5_STRMM
MPLFGIIFYYSVIMPPPISTEEEQRKRQERIDQISVETSWTVQQELMETYLHMVESSTLLEDVEAAAGAMVDLYKEIKLTWQKKVATVKSEDYVRELSWMNKVKLSMNFGERRFKAMDTQRRDANALSFATSSSTLPLSSTSQSGPTGQMHAKLPKLEMPKFSGLTIDWPNFEDRFDSAVGRNFQLAAVDKFQYLLAACQGDAKKLIESYPMEDASFQAALDLLKSTYKSHLMQKSALLAAIKSLPLISSSRPIALVKTRFALLTTYATRLGLLKLGSELAGDSKSKPQEKKSVASPGVVKCSFCEEAHYSTQCSKVAGADKRYQLAKEKRLRFNCLTAGHPIFKCTSAGRCRTCGKKHHTALHRNVESSQSQAFKCEVKDLKDVSPSTTVMMTTEAIQFMAFMAIATAPNGGIPIRIRGIIDSASHRSYITRQLIDALHLTKKSSVTMSLTTFSDQIPTLKEYEVFGCRLQSCYG